MDCLDPVEVMLRAVVARFAARVRAALFAPNDRLLSWHEGLALAASLEALLGDAELSRRHAEDLDHQLRLVEPAILASQPASRRRCAMSELEDLRFVLNLLLRPDAPERERLRAVIQGRPYD